MLKAYGLCQKQMKIFHWNKEIDSSHVPCCYKKRMKPGPVTLSIHACESSSLRIEAAHHTKAHSMEKHEWPAGLSRRIARGRRLAAGSLGSWQPDPVGQTLQQQNYGSVSNNAAPVYASSNVWQQVCHCTLRSRATTKVLARHIANSSRMLWCSVADNEECMLHGPMHGRRLPCLLQHGRSRAQMPCGHLHCVRWDDAWAMIASSMQRWVLPKAAREHCVAVFSFSFQMSRYNQLAEPPP